MADELQIEPMDSYNQALVDNVHPSDWVNPTAEGRYNMVVIGAGTAGLVTAIGVAGMGGKVALIERHLLGGDCLNYGCVPSKCLIRNARAAAAVRTAGRFAVGVPDDVEVDFGKVMERMRRLRSHISEHDSAQRCRDLGVDVFLGDGRFTDSETVEVAGQKLRFARACIATGARAAVPEVEGLGEVGYRTNETIFSLTERPGRLAVLGGGPIGCELGQAFARLGCQVTIFQRRPRLLPREDPDVAAILAEALQRDGVRAALDSNIQRVTVSGGVRTIHFETGGESDSVEVDEILVATGRAPNVESLGLEAAGVEYDSRGGVHVSDKLRTTNPRIFAAGDVCMAHKFTHLADAAARIVIQNALFFGRKKLSALTVPWCTYTDPEIAHVGISESEALERGVEIDTFTRQFAEVDRALADGETEGLAKVHVRKGTGTILGATIVAAHAGDMISEITLAMVAGAGLGTVAGVIHPYPTQAEVIKQIGDAYNRTRLTPLVKAAFRRLLAWRR